MKCLKSERSSSNHFLRTTIILISDMLWALEYIIGYVLLYMDSDYSKIINCMMVGFPSCTFLWSALVELQVVIC